MKLVKKLSTFCLIGFLNFSFIIYLFSNYETLSNYSRLVILTDPCQFDHIAFICYSIIECELSLLFLQLIAPNIFIILQLTYYVLFNVISLPQEVGQHCSRFFVPGLGQSHNRHMGELMVYIKIFSVLGFAWSSGLLTLPLSFIKPDWGRTLEKISVFSYVIFNGLQVRGLLR